MFEIERSNGFRTQLRKPVMSEQSVDPVHLGDLITPEFLAKHSRFAAEDEMFEASGFQIRNAQDFADIPDDEWDRFIGQNTSFSSWADLLTAARTEWQMRNLDS